MLRRWLIYKVQHQPLYLPITKSYFLPEVAFLLTDALYMGAFLFCILVRWKKHSISIRYQSLIRWKRNCIGQPTITPTIFYFLKIGSRLTGMKVSGQRKAITPTNSDPLKHGSTAGRHAGNEQSTPSRTQNAALQTQTEELSVERWCG